MAFTAYILFIACCVVATSASYCMVNGRAYREYNLDKYICCGKKLTPRHVNSACCEDTGMVYDMSIEKCCGGVQRIPSGSMPSDVGCCKVNGTQHTVYNTREQQCCMGKLHSKLYFGNEYAEGFCCGTKFIQTTLDPQGYQECCMNEKYEDMSEPFNNSAEICCSGRIHPIIDNKRDCCGDSPYIPSVSLCCLNSKDEPTLHVNQGYGQMGCCANANGGVIDRTTHVCVANNPIQIDMTCSSQDVVSGQCCAGRQRFNNNTHQCCGIDVVPRERECCNGAYVLEENEVCCGPFHGVQTKSDPGQDSCCSDRFSYTMYDSRRETCRHGRVVASNTCNGISYDPSRKMCCGGRLHRNMEGYECCGQHLYPPKYFTCCSGIRRHGANKSCQ